MALTIAPNLSQLMAIFHSSSNCVPLQRHNSSIDQPWEHPDDEANMVDDECDFYFKGHILKENDTGPHRIPAGWRVTSTGHLTNLPIDMSAIDRGDALANGIGVITEFNDDCLLGYSQSINDPTSCMGTISNSAGRVTGVSESADAPKWKWIRPSGTTDRMNTNTQSEGVNGESNYLKWAIDEVTKTSATPNKYWWVESPTFTAACSSTTPDFKGDYWDDTYCPQRSNNGDEETEEGIPWKFVGPVVGIVALTMMFTVYGGGA